MRKWFKTGEPWIWMTAGAVALSLVLVYAVIALITVRGMVYFWPKPIIEASYQERDGTRSRLIGELRDREEVAVARLRAMGHDIATTETYTHRYLIKTGNKDVTGADFRWIPAPQLGEFSHPPEILAIERHQWGNFYGYLKTVREQGRVVATDAAALPEALRRQERAIRLFREALEIEKEPIGAVNHRLERLRLQERELQLEERLTEARRDEFARKRQALDAEYQIHQQRLNEVRRALERDSITVETMGGQVVEIPFAKIARLYQPNAMGLGQKIGFYAEKLWEFLSDDPREANTEGGIFPSIFGTVMMVLLMSVVVTPLGIMAAIYMHEYARQGPLIRTIRISVNNLAGVPSIVYGVFGLGFFVYVLGGSIDQLLFPEALPAPTYGSPGILWASLTLAILTLPVVIVATEEGLARVPRSIREGSLALGASKAETLWRTVLPMASPAMMTGLILAVSRAAGEVAPLMLVGVVKLAPSLPVDGNFPYLHLERQFMHLGFHIYDVGFQSPNVEASRPLVYATALLLVIIILGLNLLAIMLRNRLREKQRGLEGV
ncbi:MAG: phosphate ABC transporter permease PstA [Sulfuritalea sp.]|nr:phosphate ABC transporter permease PstA [Sulfuritalea sp.]